MPKMVSYAQQNKNISAIGVGGTTLSALGSRAPAGNGGISGGSGGGGEEENNHGWGMSNPLDTL